jgi:hypothetical protein
MTTKLGINIIIKFSGPYYRYRTYWDLFNSPYADYADCGGATLKRIVLAPVAAALFLISSNIFPWDVSTTPTY